MWSSVFRLLTCPLCVTPAAWTMMYFFNQFGFQSGGILGALTLGLVVKELWRRSCPRPLALQVHLLLLCRQAVSQLPRAAAERLHGKAVLLHTVLFMHIVVAQHQLRACWHLMVQDGVRTTLSMHSRRLLMPYCRTGSRTRTSGRHRLPCAGRGCTCSCRCCSASSGLASTSRQKAARPLRTPVPSSSQVHTTSIWLWSHLLLTLVRLTGATGISSGPRGCVHL
jgi:hypothetical protein